MSKNVLQKVQGMVSLTMTELCRPVKNVHVNRTCINYLIISVQLRTGRSRFVQQRTSVKIHTCHQDNVKTQDIALACTGRRSVAKCTAQVGNGNVRLIHTPYSYL